MGAVGAGEGSPGLLGRFRGNAQALGPQDVRVPGIERQHGSRVFPPTLVLARLHSPHRSPPSLLRSIGPLGPLLEELEAGSRVTVGSPPGGCCGARVGRLESSLRQWRIGQASPEIAMAATLRALARRS